MSTTVSRPASLCPEAQPTDWLPPGLSGRYVQVPNELHTLVASPREFQLVSLLLAFRWSPSSPIVPSVRTLADTLGCSERTVRRTAASLEARNLLRREERIATDGRQMSNEYVLCGALLTLVSAIESYRDRQSDHRWQGRRSGESGKREYRNQKTGTTHRNSASQRRATEYKPFDFLPREPGWAMVDGRLRYVGLGGTGGPG